MREQLVKLDAQKHLLLAAHRRQLFCHGRFAAHVNGLLENQPSFVWSLGCGACDFEHALGQFGHTVIGIDVDQEILSVANERNISDATVGKVCANYSSYFPAYPVDAITLLFSANSIEEIATLISRTYLDLSDAGFFIFDVFVRDKLSKCSDFEIIDQLSIDGQSINILSNYHVSDTYVSGSERFMCGDETVFESQTKIQLTSDSEINEALKELPDMEIVEIMDGETLCPSAAPPGCRQRLITLRSKLEHLKKQNEKREAGVARLMWLELCQRANPSLARENKSYFKSDRMFLGISKREINAIARKFKREIQALDHKAFLGLLALLGRGETHEERSLGVVIAGDFVHRVSVNTIEDNLVEWIRDADGWDIVDELCIRVLGQVALADPKVLELTNAWVDSSNLWLRRASLLVYLPKIRKKQPPSLELLHNCRSLSSESDFFIRKAIGWVLREMTDNVYDLAISWITILSSDLSRLSFREATRKLPKSVRERTKT